MIIGVWVVFSVRCDRRFRIVPQRAGVGQGVAPDPRILGAWQRTSAELSGCSNIVHRKWRQHQRSEPEGRRDRGGICIDNRRYF